MGRLKFDFHTASRLGSPRAASRGDRACPRTDGELVRYRRLVGLSRERVVRSAARSAGRHPRWAYYCNARLRRRARRLWPPNFCAVRSGHVGAAGLFFVRDDAARTKPGSAGGLDARTKPGSVGVTLSSSEAAATAASSASESV